MIKKCMTPTCGACKKLTKILEQLDVEFEDVDLTQNLDFAQQNQISTVPTLIKEDGTKLVGLASVSQIKEFLNIR